MPMWVALTSIFSDHGRFRAPGSCRQFTTPSVLLMNEVLGAGGCSAQPFQQARIVGLPAADQLENTPGIGATVVPLDR